ncbi:MAG: translation initiation factor IF-2 [Clostridia bacterium]|nr:translation initiation factor IF-2 [Clostridia bacterium]
MPSNETKIVKATPRKDDADVQAGASKVQIKAVDPAILEAQKKKKTTTKKTTATKTTEGEKAVKKETTKKAPAGTAMPKSKVPAGTPMPKSKVVGTAMPKSAVPQKKAVTPQTEEEIEKVVEEKPKRTRKKADAPVVEAEVKEEVKAPEAPKAEEPVKEEVKVEAPKEEVKPVEVKEEPKPVEAPKAEEPAKEEVKAEEPKPEPFKEESKPAEAPKAEEKPAEKKEAPKPEREKIDYVPHIGVKIIKRAADEPKPEPKKPEPKPQKPQKNDRNDRNDRQGGKPDRNNNNNNNRNNNNNNNNKDQKRQPKEYVGKRGENKDADNAPRKKTAPKTNATGEKVVAFTSAQNGDNRGKKGKDKDRDKNKKHGKDMFDDMPTDLQRKNKNKHSKYKETKVEEVEEVSQEVEEAIATGGYVINVPITLGGFCEQTEVSTSKAIMALMKMGIMANVNQNLDEETAVLLGMELGITVAVQKAEEIVEEEGIDLHEDRENELTARPPIITVMGHVDHGKTSILDAIRSTNVTAGEAGGITQHIGASEVEHNGQRIVFLDTPGHEAFTAMRARGAHITDIAVLVVAADDSVMPQTIESISHAKAAGVPIIVAMNKMDKPAANPDLVKKDLANQGLLVEDWGGDVICVPVSAKTKMGIPQLLDMILLQAEMLELKANPDRLAQGTVIEARLDKNRGPVATLLVMNGTLQAGAAVVAGTASGRVRVMTNSHGEIIKKAGPATAVEITGLTEVPEAGDEFYMVKDEKTAREITERRKLKIREEVLAKNAAMSLEKLFSQLQEGEVQDLNIIIKADVQGSVGALEQSLEKLHNDNVRVKIIHTGVGTVTESDVMLAGTSNAVIIGFNIRPSSAVQAIADREGVEIRTYRVIYEIIDDIEAAMKGMLAPEFKEVVIGKIEVRDTFKVPNVGVIAGGYVLEGKVARGAKLRLVRDGIVIHEGEISSLRRFKDDVKEVASGYECGIGIDKYNDIKTGDIIEAFKMEEVKRD